MILVVFDLPVSSQHKSSHMLDTNPKYQDHHQLRRLPTQSDITGQHFGLPRLARDPDGVMSRTAASVLHTYVVASHRLLLSSSLW